LAPLLIIRAMRPLVLIRFCRITGARLGNFAADPEFYMCERDLGLQPKAIDIFYYDGDYFCNQQLKPMFDRALRVWQFAMPLEVLNRKLPGGAAHQVRIISRDVWGSRDAARVIPRTGQHLFFTPEEERFGQEELRRIGVPDGAAFICFYGRDSAYLQAAQPSTSGWAYHDFRDVTIENYLPMAEMMTERGYYAIRMGAVVKDRITSNDPMIIDYASNYRTDFLDVYLGAKCKFFIASTGGLWAIPGIFRRPIAHVNFVPMEQTTSAGSHDLYIPKRLWHRSQKRYLTYPEVFNLGISRFQYSDLYQGADVEPVENTPEDIAAVALEMDDRLNGTWLSNDEDNDLQDKFWSHVKPDESFNTLVMPIGAMFLRQNKELLV
jgi:putative glycosyltransferase (TIGR04372 family)